VLWRIKVNFRKSSPGWRKSRSFAPDQLSVTFWPYDVGSDKKVTTEERMCAAGLDLDFGLHSQLDRAATEPNAGLHRTSVDWANYPEK
jgi:hypothetical protein